MASNYEQYNGEIPMNSSFPGFQKRTKMVDSNSQILSRIEERVAMIPTLQARVSEMHGVLNQVLYNVKRISEHLSIQPPSAHVRPQVQQQMMGFSRRENMASTGLSQSMTGLGYEGFMQEKREAEDRVEKPVRPVLSGPTAKRPLITEVTSESEDEATRPNPDSQPSEPVVQNLQRETAEIFDDGQDFTDLKTESTRSVAKVPQDTSFEEAVPQEVEPQKVEPSKVVLQGMVDMAPQEMGPIDVTPQKVAPVVEEPQEVKNEVLSKPVELNDFSSENEEQNETDKVKTLIAEAQNQFSKLKCRRTARLDDNRIQFVYGKGEDGLQKEVKSGSFTQNIKSSTRRPERRDRAESRSDSDEELSANVKFVPSSGSSASSYKASVQQKSEYQNFQNSSSLGAAGGSLKSSLKTSSLSLKSEPDDRPDGGSDLRILTESELEELTLKEANRAADCTDHKSQGADTILCIDTSSSMEGKKFQQITEFIDSFLEGIEDVAVENSLEENIAVVSFGNQTRVVQNLTNDYSKIRDAVESLAPGGPSPIMTGLVLCMSAIYNRGGVVTFGERKIFPRIILFTDGGVTDQRIFTGPDTIVKQGLTKKEVWHKLMEFAERFRTHADPRNLVCVPIGEDADMTLLGQLLNTAGGTLVQPEDVQTISHHFLINTVVAKVIHDGALRGPELSDDELKQKIQATEGAGDFTEALVEETLAMIKRDSEQRKQGGATGGLNSSITKTKEMPPIGSRVRRGPDWRWDNQDDDLPGTVVAHKARGYLIVEWDNGNRGKYRYGAESGAKDVRMVDEPRMLPPGRMVAVGVRARRGTDWEWESQDGGEGSLGVIFKVEDSGIVHVRWDNGKRGNYRFGLFGKYDVEVSPRCIVMEGATCLSDGGNLLESREKKGQWQWQDKDGRWRDHAGETSDKIEHVYQIRHGKGTVVVDFENEKYRVIPEKKCQKNVSTGAEYPIRRLESMAKFGVHLKEKQRSHIIDLTHFIQTVTEGNIETVKTIIKQHPYAVNKTVEGKTALQIACYEGHLDMVKFLLESKADPNFQDSEGDSSLHFSAQGNEPNTIRELIKRKVNVNVVNKKNQTPLHIAVGKNYPECVQILLKAEADPSQKDCDGDTPMHFAIAQKSEILKNLLESPLANFTQTNGKGFNVLQWAVMNGFKLAVDIILKKNPEIVNNKMAEGVSALHLAALNNCIETANVLVKSGHCNVNAIDKTKRTPLIMSVSQGHQHMMEMLIAAGSNVNAQDFDGNTALHVAMWIQALPTQQEMNIEIICALLEAKADVNIRNKKGLQPLDLAEDEKTRKFMISLAQKAKADALQTTRKGIGIPADWEPMTLPYHFKRVLLSPDSNGMMQREYKMVAKKINKTLSHARILQIERVQNEYSWETYQLTRRQIEHRYGGIGCANEKDLFHGTVIKHINTICKNNFDFRLAGTRVGTLLGYGTYFARDAKYSDLYAEADRDRNKYMFLAKVLCGKWNQGKPDYKRPPPVDPNDSHSDLYDSCVDNVENPKIFCIYDKNQYYPHYLIKYTFDEAFNQA